MAAHSRALHRARTVLSIGSTMPSELECAFVLAKANLNFHTSSQVELHQSVNCLIGGLDDIEQALVSTDLVRSRASLLTCGEINTVKFFLAGTAGA